MKKDNLEKFIAGHRNEFDYLDPDPALWDSIRKRYPEIKRFNWTKVLTRAAAVAVIFIVSYYFHDFMSKRHAQSGVAQQQVEQPPAGGMYQNLMEARYYYSAQIEQRKEEFYHLAGNNPPLRNEINSELLELDKALGELKQDLKDNADNEEVVVAMIQNYRLKLEILEDILSQLQTKKAKKKSHEYKSINL